MITYCKGTFSIGNHDAYTLGEFKDDQMERHTHNMHHEHNRGSMHITGGMSNCCFESGVESSGVLGLSEAYNSISIRKSSDWGIHFRTVSIDTNNNNGNNWTGQTSGPLDISGNAIYNTGINSGRTWDTTHGKQIGVRYLIKAL